MGVEITRQTGESPDWTEDQLKEIEEYVDQGRGSYYEAWWELFGVKIVDEKEARELIPTNPSAKELGRQALLQIEKRSYICGDCSKKVRPGESCPHMRVGKRGGRYASDDRRYQRK